MEKKTVFLTGYFDRNFGDDMMMKLVVRSLPEVTFLVADTADTPLLSERNVAQRPYAVCRRFPKLVVTGSGFMIHTKAALRSELLKFFRGSHPGAYCLGCNLEPLDSPIKEFLIGRKLNKFKLITCRDQASYRWLRQNTRKPEIHCLPDILFSLPDAWLPEAREPEKLGISLMHRVGDREDCAYYRAMAEVADEWTQKTGKGVLLMAFDAGKEDDLFACRAVQALMRYPDQAETVAHWDGSELPAAFARCEKIIGARFHSMVLALRMGIPFFPVIFREKMQNLIRDVHYPVTGCRIDSIRLEAVRRFLWEESSLWLPPQELLSGAEDHTRLLQEELKGC